MNRFHSNLLLYYIIGGFINVTLYQFNRLLYVYDTVAIYCDMYITIYLYVLLVVFSFKITFLIIII